MGYHQNDKNQSVSILKSKKTAIAATAFLAICAAALMACGGDDSGANSSTAPKDNSDIAPEAGTGLVEQNLVNAKKFMAASANPLATKAGYDVLKNGGSAIDAMITIQATLGLVEPQSSGLGGGAFLVYWDNAAKKLTTFDARETAPLAATPELFLDKDGKPLSFMNAVVSGLSVGTPAIPKLLDDAHKRYGKLEWKSLFAYPVELAEKGFEVSPRMAQSILQNEQSLKRHASTANYFFPNGNALKAGDLLKNQDYANSLQILANEGSKSFYSGQLAQNIVDVVTGTVGDVQTKGALAMQDFENYRVIEREPVCQDYKPKYQAGIASYEAKYEICGMGAPSSGAIALGQIFGILQNKEFSDDANGWRLISEASRVAFADRNFYVGDPDFVNVPTSKMLANDYLAGRFDEINTLINNNENVSKTVSYGVFDDKSFENQKSANAIELPSTTHISVVDSEGNVVSMTSSIENAFGSTLMANGYLLNNELTDFAFTPRADEKLVANSVGAGKRPRSSMSPTIVLKDGSPYISIGSPGGSRIIGYTAKTIISHINWGMDIQKAISQPNILNRGSAIELEQNTKAAEMAADFEKMGYTVQTRDLNSGVQAIVINNSSENRLQGGADPRREGKVMGE